MNRIFTKSIALIALVGAFSLFSTSKAEAALSLKLTDGTNTVIINDNVAPDTLPGILGVVSFAGSVGIWEIIVDTGIGFPAFTDQPHMDLAYSAADGNLDGLLGPAGSYLEAQFTQTGMTAASPSFSFNIGGTNHDTQTTSAIYTDAGNAAFGLTTLASSTGPDAAGGFTVSGGGALGLAGPYSMTMVVRITKLIGGEANASGDFELVPEPVSLALFGLGLAGLAARRRKA